MGAMLKRPLGIILLAGALLVAGLVGIAAFWGVLPRTSNTSPLAALFLLMWSCTYFVTATLTWRRSRLAPPSFLAAIGLLLFPASFISPGGQLIPFVHGYRSCRFSRLPVSSESTSAAAQWPLNRSSVTGCLWVQGEILAANILSGAGLVVAACRAQPWQSTSPGTRREDDVGRRVGCWLASSSAKAEQTSSSRSSRSRIVECSNHRQP
jgi:hypothetical protein